MHDRLRAVCELSIPRVRESAGRHEYDGQVPDLSPDAVRAKLAALATPAPRPAAADPDPEEHDAAHLAAFETMLRISYGEAELHRRSVRPLLEALDVSVYDRDYAPEAERRAARHRHLAAWPDAIDAGVAALDRLPAPVAAGLLRSVRGLEATLGDDDGVEAPARVAHARLVAHVERAAADGPPDAALGEDLLAALLGDAEAAAVDLAEMEVRADVERKRLDGLLRDACAALDPDRPAPAVVEGLTADHPDAAGVLDEAQRLTAEVLAFTRERGLLDGADGDCRVAPSPPSRRWATAMLSWAGPYERDGPSYYFVTPPDPAWPPARRRDWLKAFSRTTLPSTTVHEVAPGHFSHGRLLRLVAGDVRKTLQSSAFVEGWAHYAEELLLEEGYRREDPRFQAGVALKGLLRVVRLAVALGVHRGTMTIDEATARFAEHAFLRGPVAEAEARRATFDPTYGRYTWGKLAILDLRDAARRRWGAGFSLRRFHHALLDLGAPPLGLIGTALEHG
jgi:hypothetical protein